MSEESLANTEAANSETAALSQGHWAAAILLAGLIGWLAYSYPPMTWRVPDSMLNIGALSPKSDQDMLKAVETANLWKNTILKFSMAGLALGLTGVILSGRSLVRHGRTAAITLVGGLVGGLLAGVLGLLVRQYLDLEYPIPLIDDARRPLFCDGVVFSVISVLLLLPISTLLLFQPRKADRQKAFVVPLAGVLTGLVVPFAGAMVLPTYTNTSIYPPAGMELTLLWFVTLVLITMVLIVFMGSRSSTSKPAPELSAA